MDNKKIQKSIEQIIEMAHYAVETFDPIADIKIGFNRDSVEWVQGFIERERIRRKNETDAPNGLINVIGAFLGACMISAAGGKWHYCQQNKSFGILFSSDFEGFPFAKVAKQFENGLEGGDSILSFYDISIQYMAKGKLPE